MVSTRCGRVTAEALLKPCKLTFLLNPPNLIIWLSASLPCLLNDPLLTEGMSHMGTMLEPSPQVPCCLGTVLCDLGE